MNARDWVASLLYLNKNSDLLGRRGWGLREKNITFRIESTMEIRFLFTFTFLYACLLYAVTQQGEIQSGKVKGWCVVDFIVVAVFLKNAVISYFLWNSEPFQSLVALANVSTVLWFVMPQTGLGKRFSMQFGFMNFTLAPLVYVCMYGGEENDCATRFLGFVAAGALPAWFVVTTSNEDIHETSHVGARACAWASLLMQNLVTWPALATCLKGKFFMQNVVWLSLIRFTTCGLLGYTVTVERMDMQPNAALKG
jgi:hypothetical protein